MDQIKLYRCDYRITNNDECESYSEQEIEITYEEFSIVKETKEGFWIEKPAKYNHKKSDYNKYKSFVLKDQSGKRFAYLTKERALEAFYFRRMRHNTMCKRVVKNNNRLIGIIEMQMELCKNS